MFIYLYLHAVLTLQSASTPVTAAFFSLVNSARIGAKMSPLGWMNPSIYTDYALYTVDITSGLLMSLTSVNYGCCVVRVDSAVY